MFNTSKLSIIQNWEHGEVDIQIPRSSQAIGYVIKYLSKRIYKTTPGNVTPEFSIMSKGIGLHYVDKMKSWHKNNLDILYTANTSKMITPMSRFYREKLLTESERIKQIPIIKKNIEDNENQQIKQLGEEQYYKQLDGKRRAFVNRVKSKNKPRKDPGDKL